MKRMLTATCGLTAIGALSAFLFVHIEPRSYAQQPTTLLDNPDIIFSENPEQAAVDEAVFRAVEDVEPAALIVDQSASDVREEMLKLLRRRVELMDEKEISALFEQVKSELNEAEAKRALETIRAELEQLAERYPDTRAAQQAGRLLQSLAATANQSQWIETEAGDADHPAFIKVNEIVVNLNEDRLNRYLDVSIALQVTETRRDEVSARLEAEHAILQNWLLSHLSEQTVDGTRGAAGQERLRAEIKDHFNAVLFDEGDAAIEDVLFQKFAVQ